MNTLKLTKEEWDDYSDLSESFIASKFYEYTLRTVYKASSGVYNAECPICGEGKSSGRKKRAYYIPKKKTICCHNCNENWIPIHWISIVSGMNRREIIEEYLEYSGDLDELRNKKIIDRIVNVDDVTKNNINNKTESLPEDSINLFDPIQVEYYKDNRYVKLAVSEIKNRRLDTAINRPRSLWISLVDKLHKNRLVIPFYDADDKYKIINYQSRALTKKDRERGKYLGKLNTEKTIFNMNNVSSDVEYIFVLEGPIDAMFIRNGVALTQLSPTTHQNEILRNKFPLHNKIFILDNQEFDSKEVRQQRLKLLDEGVDMFIWPKELKDFKDFNDLCKAMEIDEIPYKLIVKNTLSGFKARMMLES